MIAVPDSMSQARRLTTQLEASRERWKDEAMGLRHDLAAAEKRIKELEVEVSALRGILATKT